MGSRKQVILRGRCGRDGFVKEGKLRGGGGGGVGSVRARGRGEEGTCYPPCSPPL